MLRGFRDLARLFHAARVLAEHDALIPREMARRVPLPLKLARALLIPGPRAFAAPKRLRPRRRTSRPPAAEPSIKPGAAVPGVRLAAALESLGPAYIKLGQLL